MSWQQGLILGVVAAASTTARADQNETRKEADAVRFFETKIRPIFVDHCYGCHSAETKPAGDFRVDDRHGFLSGGKTGPAVDLKTPASSLLLKRITHADPKRRMPAEGKPLSPEQIALLTKWIEQGAPWPQPKAPASLNKSTAEYEKLKAEHWAWQPLTKPSIPSVKDAGWPKNDVDRFLLAELETRGLKPVGVADKRTLIRRVSFDLTGLPPTPEAVDAFLADPSPTAFETLVDRLIASPQFGERWGRHWLDVARYGESTGPSRNVPYPHAWKYRDYVVDSVNADVPYDCFLREQIAGDLLPAANEAERDRHKIATGFLALGVKDVNQRFKTRFVMDNVDEQIDAVSRSVLALTVSCARCHDHKFDPIPTKDYYALAGIFTSTDNCSGVRNKMGGGGLDYYDPSMLVTLSGFVEQAPTAEVEKLKTEVAEAKKKWDAIRGTKEGLEKAPNGQPKQRPFRLKFERMQAELAAINEPAARGLAVHGVRDAKSIGDTEIRLRGEAEKLGPKTPRSFLSAVSVPGAAPVNEKQSGRLELAFWLTSPKNPLTPRVAVNRVWQNLFGRGIVSSVDNFGVTGDKPSHPELLDHLASKFIDEGWSVKKLVRTLVLSRAYQLSSDSSPANRNADPGNSLVWRHSPRRLTAEEYRDGLLAAAGTLDLRRSESVPARRLKMIEMRDNGPEARIIHESNDGDRHRSIYLPLLRGVTPRSLEAFDPVEQTLVTGTRDATTVPSQALFVLNSPFVRKQAFALSEGLLKNEKLADADRIVAAYRRILGRDPTASEKARAEAFVGEYRSAYAAPATKPGPTKATAKKTVEVETAPVNPDEADQTGVEINEGDVHPRDSHSASWLAFVQALFASAEFRFVR